MLRLLPTVPVLLVLAACTGGGQGGAPQRPRPASVVLPEAPDNETGRAVYIQHCKLCHGVDGQMGGSGAANLAISLLSAEEARTVITKGRNLMQAYEDRLSAEEIDAVSRYIQLFKATP